MGKNIILCATVLFVAAGVSLVQSATVIKGGDLVINGESFFALSSQIKADLETHARADGVIGQSESFRQIAVSGSNISQIVGFYDNCTPKPVYLISDGGGIDMMGSCPSPITPDCPIIKNALAALQQYITKMKAGGTKKFLWMRYPDPQGSQWAALKANQDVYNPEVEKICKASTDPKCLWVDLRPVWAGHYGAYTSDGIHPTAAGSQATADAFWQAMKDSNFFALGTPVQPIKIETIASSIFLGQAVSNKKLVLSLFLAQPTTGITMRVATLTGRTVLSAEKKERGSGLRTVQFPLGSIVPGMYCLDVKAGRFAKQSALLVQ